MSSQEKQGKYILAIDQSTSATKVMLFDVCANLVHRLSYPHQQLGFGRNPELYYRRAQEFFDLAKESGKPFYFMVNSDDPHRPFFVPGEKLDRGMAKPSRIYNPEEIDVPGFLPDLPDVRKELT